MSYVASEWVAPVASSVAVVVVGVAGIVATYKAGSRQQDTALAVARQQGDVQVAVAREERQQRRLEAAYLELLTAMTRIYYWVQTVYPLFTRTAEEFTMPPVPEVPDIEKIEAKWTAYWSPRVEQLMEGWGGALTKLRQTGSEISLGRSTEATGQASGIDVAGRLLELPELKQAVYDADKRIREQIRLELLGRHDGHAEVVERMPTDQTEVDSPGPSADPS
jgi:hypothetical protein